MIYTIREKARQNMSENVLSKIELKNVTCFRLPFETGEQEEKNFYWNVEYSVGI